MMKTALSNLSKTISIFTATCAIAITSLNGAMNATAPVSYEKALSDANKVAALNDSWTVMRGAGDSMTPLYGENSVLVIDSVSYDSLKTGMVAVYRDATGELVAHPVKGQTGEGWVAKGINNRTDDPGLVNAENFVGVVFGVLNASSAPSIASNVDALPVVYGKKY